MAFLKRRLVTLALVDIFADVMVVSICEKARGGEVGGCEESVRARRKHFIRWLDFESERIQRITMLRMVIVTEHIRAVVKVMIVPKVQYQTSLKLWSLLWRRTQACEIGT